jgi:HPt (histidine-containing phosphotransfer) domain-containing protein
LIEPIVVCVDSDLADLIPGFLDNRRRDSERLRELVRDEQYAEIRLIGHSMKGAGGGYGFDAITDIGAAIERAALAQDAAGVRSMIVNLDDYLARVTVSYTS